MVDRDERRAWSSMKPESSFGERIDDRERNEQAVCEF